MRDTAISKDTKANSTTKTKGINISEEAAIWLPSKVINRCPAIIFADNRIERVTGRITLLILSIITMKGISTPGVLWGTKWANISLLYLIHPNNIIPSHKGIAIGIDIDMCLVEVKIYGNNPIKLFTIIKINRDIRITLKYLLEEIIILNSLCKIFMTKFE